MKIQKKQAAAGGEAWLATYGDMVTLLLCFFVLMFSMSSIDSAKLQILVEGLNPNASVLSSTANSTPAPGGEEAGIAGEGLLSEDPTLENFYQTLKEYIEQNDLAGDIDIQQGDGYVFIAFRNNIFFEANSYIIRAEGRQVLDFLCGALGVISEDVNEVKILGHTNQAVMDKVNDPRTDRFLSSNRATEVLLYMQDKNVIDAGKLMSIGMGQHYPIASFDTEENRSKNRRVEILISKSDAVGLELNKIYDLLGESQPVVVPKP